MLEFVLESLEKSRGKWPDVSKGSGVPYHTLTKIAQRQIENPGVNHVQQLADYFTQQAQSAA